MAETQDFPSIARFLQKVMKDEKGKSRGNLGRLIIATYGVFLDSQFILSDGSLFPEQCPPMDLFSFSVQYAITNLAGPAVLLKFSVVRNYVIIYGFVSGNNTDVQRVCFQLSKLAAPLISSLHGSIGDKEEKEILKFWHTVKSELCYPLQIKICYENGIDPPPCFICLPTELKLRVLKFLPGVGVAKIGCTCKELGFLSSCDELWKQKFEEEFGRSTAGTAEERRWKKRFVMSSINKKRIVEIWNQNKDTIEEASSSATETCRLDNRRFDSHRGMRRLSLPRPIWPEFGVPHHLDQQYPLFSIDESDWLPEFKDPSAT